MVLRRHILPRIRSPRILWRREASTSLTVEADGGRNPDRSLHRISEDSWRKFSRHHQNRIFEILSPGLTPLDHPLNTGLQRQKRQKERRAQKLHYQNRPDAMRQDSSFDTSNFETITALDPKHPVYNFLIEYYGLKGTKGVRKLMRFPLGMKNALVTKSRKSRAREILLEGATEHDFFSSLHGKGAVLDHEYETFGGVVFSPWRYVYGNEPKALCQLERDVNSSRRIDGETKMKKNELDGRRPDARINKFGLGHSNSGPLASFLWYRSLLQRTLEATPVLHCYGLHEWAMQYQPANRHNSNSSLPPSSKYQAHLKLRVDQETLNQTVEENNLYCTHVDAWKFFAPEALPLNQFHKQQTIPTISKTDFLPHPRERPGWLLRSEQPACVHTTMDLLKIALKLGPFCEASLLCQVLELTVAARRLDVAASPYDAQTDYRVDPILIETPVGRNEYKQQQMELMKQAQPIRRDLLENYEQFLAALHRE